MPSIKFSALVSDMKGKANGSVFSKNKQGNYFRNNPNGGGRKTARWDKQKVQFGNLANTFRSLTIEDKDAWNNLAASWPLLNKFGDEYYPSGYQLFMKLNGNLVSKGFSPLTTPGVKRTLPNPNDAIITPSEDFTFTPRSAASFIFPPSLSAADNSPFCPQCYDNVGGTCVPSTTGPTFDNCVLGTLNPYSVALKGECSVDQDCVDAGLGTASDVECQDGICVYVGEGIVNVYNSGYVFNMSSMLRDGGEWQYFDHSGLDIFTLSFQLTSFDEIIRLLQTSNSPIILVSNYKGEGKGFHIRIRPQDKATCLFDVGFGFENMSDGSQVGTSVNTIEVPITYLKNSPVVSINMDFIDPLNFRFSIGNSGWLNYTTNGWNDYLKWNYPNWQTPDYVGTYAENKWKLDASIWGLVFGAGIEGTQYNYAIADVRAWDVLLDITDVEKVSRGIVLMSERALYPLNGKPRPKCSFDLCDAGQPCTGTKECVCKHGICGYWENPTLENYAANNPIYVLMQFSSPVFGFNDPGAGDYSLSYTGFWIKQSTGVFVDNQAIYAPSVTVTAPQPEESGFVAVFWATYPGGNNSSAYAPVVIGNRSMNQFLTTELHDMLKENISNFPDGSYYDVYISILDLMTGEEVNPPRLKKKVARFKAGSELSSSVS